jgi:ribonuclease HI/uncharacterized protein (DUF433 family)
MLAGRGDRRVNRIVKDPKILGGKPHIKGTKIPCELILELLAGGSSPQEICGEFPNLSEQDVRAVLAYALNLVKKETAVPGDSAKKSLVIYIDGASRGNPGPAGIGIAIYDEKGRLVDELCEYIGRATNNVAEYRALSVALEKARALGAKELTIYSDCELLVKQMAGEYRVKDRVLKNLVQTLRESLKNYDRVNIKYIPRERNKKADGLANKGINLG